MPTPPAGAWAALPHSKDGGPHILWVQPTVIELASFSISLCFHTFCLIIAVDGIIDADKVSVCHKTVMWPPELCQCTAGSNSALAFRGHVIVLWLWHVCGFSSYLLCAAYFFFYI